MNEMQYPIDAVITWVDGNDPEHRRKRLEYEKGGELSHDDVAGDIRYVSIGEINFCVASILRYAPFVRTIYIVTDNQDPHLEPFIENYFPGQSSKIRIIDHKVIYRGYEQYLPVFCSTSIETLIWRIPGLSEHFIYFNDDFMLVRPTSPEDYFDGDKVVCYANKFSIPFANLIQFLKPRSNGHKKVTFKHKMVLAAEVLGIRDYFYRLGHNPQSMRVSVYREYFEKHPDVLERNIKYRFRDIEQFQAPELGFLLCRLRGELVLRPKKGNNLYLLPKGRSYMKCHLDKFRKSTREKFCCVNSLNYASEEDREATLAWLRERILPVHRVSE
ncbi:MAG: Stealth CR1 domain-containing protein [Candidatus Cryptobacteroides sp.]|nr:stealth family protein [Bacteroidales bacterium]MDY3964106.1 Stealth CR1 domain-containing protein [Candidatus Cryptobacteroides sp.]